MTMTRLARRQELDVARINFAREYALEKHGAQNHGSLTIKDHLYAVTQKAYIEYDRAFPHQDIPIATLMQAAWLHDVLEDTNSHEVEIHELFGADVAEIVSAVTDSIGPTRKDRHLLTYYRTRRSKGAVFVKMCDRWHNQSRSLANHELRFAREYAKEYEYFKFALFEFPVFSAFWNQLDEQAKALKAFVDSPPLYVTEIKPMGNQKELPPCVSANPIPVRA